MEEEEKMPQDLKEKFLNNILNDSDRLSRLINNILDFEKLSTGRQQLDIRRNNIKKTISKAISSIQHIASNKGIKIINEDDVDFEFDYDEDRILQVLTNLLSNAIKFTESNNGIISVDYILKEKNIEVYVRDNGNGIPDEDFKYIFDKFYQTSDQNTRKPQGSGLGLAISKQIIENHNGKIWAEKGKKVGATFGFKLPFN